MQHEAALHCWAVSDELGEAERWRALEEGGKRWSLGRATNVFIGQRREQTQRRDESNEEKRQDRQPIRAA